MKKSSFMPFYAILAIFSVCNFNPSNTNAADRFTTTENSAFTNKSVPQILVITDKDYYQSREKIWFKGYLTDQTNNTPDSTQYNIYAELWSVDQQRILSVTCLSQNGVFYGSFNLEVSIPDGNYVLIFYSDHFPETKNKSIFQKYIYISNPGFANQISNQQRRFNRNFNKNLIEMQKQVSFRIIPEGRSMIMGVPVRLGIVIQDFTGKGIETSGMVKDKTGKTVSSFQTNANGRAMVSYIPDSENDEFLIETVSYGNQTVTAETLNQSRISLCVKQTENDQLEISIQLPEDEATHQRLKLIVDHQKGIVLDEELQTGKFHQRTLSINDLETGLLKITVYSSQNEKIAERNVFISRDDQVYFDIRARGISSSETNGIDIELQALDANGNSTFGDFSISVTTHNSSDRLYENSIFTQLFLTKYTNEIIPEISKYFDYDFDNNLVNLDLFLMTSVIPDNLWALNFNASESKSIPGIMVSGTLNDPVSNQRIPNMDLTLKVLTSEGTIQRTSTDDNGMFYFPGLMIFDSTFVEIIPQLIAGRISPKVSLSNRPGSFGENIIDDLFNPNPLTLPQSITMRGSNWTNPQRSYTSTNTASAYGNPEQTIFPDPNINYNNVLEILRDKAVGLDISPSGHITLRGPSSIGSANIPIFIIDGVESQGAFFAVNVKDVERIEIFKGASAVAFGARGANGALVAYTKRKGIASSENDNPNIFNIDGIHVPQKFEEIILPEDIPNNQQKISTTVYWNPAPQPNENGIINFQFPFIPGETFYRIVVQGITQHGKTAYGEFIIGQ